MRRKRKKAQSQSAEDVRHRKASKGREKAAPHRKQDKHSEAFTFNSYKGWVPFWKNDRSERVAILKDTLQLTQQQFWMAHISKRRPAIIPSTVASDICNLLATEEWSNENLESISGDVKVEVEKQLKAESFGKGQKVEMTFQQFLKQLEAGDESLYLTTQEAETLASGLPNVLAPPLSKSSTLLDSPPAIMGDLVLQSVNLWMGASSEGTSSGLHHDYHDNLYALLMGRKRFRLWSPASAESMYTHGKLQKIHPNGRIVYEGQGDILADGSHRGDVDAFLKQGCQESTGQGAARSEEGARCMKKEKVTLDSDDDSHFGGSSIWDGQDDFDDMMLEDSEASKPDASESEPSKEEPPSFSRIDLSAKPHNLAKEFPKFPGTRSAIECTLEAGDLLYLPAGWFHEVTSYSTPHNAAKGSWHMALNFWYHPPDNLESLTYKKPYITEFWRHRSQCH